MNKNQKRAINRSYNARLFKVLEITRHKPTFPTEITTLIFDFAKAMAIGEKINAEITKGKTKMHEALIIIRTLHEIDDDLFFDASYRGACDRVVEFLTIVPWPLNKEDECESKLLLKFVHDQFRVNGPPAWELTLQARFKHYPFKPEDYLPEKWV